MKCFYHTVVFGFFVIGEGEGYVQRENVREELMFYTNSVTLLLLQA